MDDVELSMAEHEVEMVAVGAAVLADAAPPSPTPTCACNCGGRVGDSLFSGTAVAAPAAAATSASTSASSSQSSRAAICCCGCGGGGDVIEAGECEGGGGSEMDTRTRGCLCRAWRKLTRMGSGVGVLNIFSLRFENDYVEQMLKHLPLLFSVVGYGPFIDTMKQNTILLFLLMLQAIAFLVVSGKRREIYSIVLPLISSPVAVTTLMSCLPLISHSKRSKLLLTQHTFIILEGVCLIAIAVGQPYLVPAWNPSKDIVALTVNDVIALGSSAVVFFSVTLLLTAVNVRSTAVGCVCVALAIGILEVALWNAQLCDIVPFAFFIIAGASLWSMQAYQLHIFHRLDYVSKTCLQFEQRKLEEEQQRNMDLLHMILPPEIAEKLKSCMGRDNLATNHPMVSVLFLNFNGLEGLSAKDTVLVLGKLFVSVDNACSLFHIEKIKTIGTAIMAAVGIPRANCDDATRAALFALHVQHIATLFAQQRGLDISVKVGIASGSVTSGVIGFEKPKFDIFGDTVNTSARMMQTCPRGSIQLTDFTVHQLSGGLKLAKSPTPVFVKGKGDMVTYFLLGSEGDVHLQVSRENMSQDSILTPSYPKALLKTNNKLISESDFTTLEHVRLQPLPSLNRILLRFSNIEAEFLHNYFTVFFVTLRPHMLVLGVCTATSVLVSYLVGCFSINYAMLAETPTLIIVLLCFTPLLTRFPCQVHYSIFVICISTSLAWLVVYSLGWTNDAWPLMVIGHLAVLHSFCRVLFRFVTCASIIIAPVAIICGIVIDDWPWGRILVSMITILLALAYGHYATEKAMRINFGLEKLFAEKKQLLLEEQEASNQLLLSILPPQILQELTASEETDEVIAETVSSGSLLMADIVGFTTICDSIPAHTVVTMLDTLFRELDSSIAGLIASGVQKLKTIGDAYVVGANLPFCPCVDHATKLTQVAQAMVRAIATVNRDHRKGLLENLPEIRMRIGVHSGPVLAGVIRMKSLSFDCWGPSVYIADALQTSGAANQIHISDSVKELLDDRLFSCTPAPDMPYGDSVYKTYFVAG